MPPFCQTTFPDAEYLQDLVEAQKRKVEGHQTPAELLVMWAGASLNWLGDRFTDPAVAWTKETVAIDALTLTGTGPEWNAVVIDRAGRSPAKLREILASEPEVRALFADAAWSDVPILARVDMDGALKVLDGMHRAIAGIRDGHPSIVAWIARRAEGVPPKPSCEPHVVYDLLRAYQIGASRDRAGLVAALRFVKMAYGNAEELMRVRFGPGWAPNAELQGVLAEVLAA